MILEAIFQYHGVCLVARELLSILAGATVTKEKNNMSTNGRRTLTFIEKKAAEAAFRGLPIDPHWPMNAQAIYYGIVAHTGGRNIVEESAQECLVA